MSDAAINHLLISKRNGHPSQLYCSKAGLKFPGKCRIQTTNVFTTQKKLYAHGKLFWIKVKPRHAKRLKFKFDKGMTRFYFIQLVPKMSFTALFLKRYFNMALR